MQLDLGLQGFAILLAISLVFGVAAQVLLGRGRTLWLGLLAAAGWFAGGLVASEGVVGTLTERDIQPIIGGLAFDEALLGGIIGGVVVAAVAWFVTRRGGQQRPSPSWGQNLARDAGGGHGDPAPPGRRGDPGSPGSLTRPVARRRIAPPCR